MADRVEVFDVTVPTGTPRSAPLIAGCSFAPGTVERVDVVIPAGVAALAGFAIGYGNQPVIPNTVGAFILGNNEVWSTALTNLPTGGRWTLIGYNEDLYDHTFHVRFYVTELRDPAPPIVLPEVIGSTDVTPDVSGVEQ